VAEKKGGDLKAFYMVLGATAVIAAGALGWSAFGTGLSSAAMEPIASIVVGEIEDLEALVAMATGVERGDPNASISILEFGDFQCPSCQQFATFVKPQIDLAYVDQGTVRFVFHDYPVVSAHRYAFFAARAARCALDQGEQYFWPFHDQLFAHQSTWSASSGPPVSTFEGYAATIGLDVDDFAGCLDSDRHADVVSANLRLGIELGVDRTPTVFVSKNGRSVRVTRWNDFEAYKSVIDRLLAEDAEEDAEDGL
jgi:protein-disulfide isomerase